MQLVSKTQYKWIIDLSGSLIRHQLLFRKYHYGYHYYSVQNQAR